mmetsp:Transcript_33412/g.77071  ORF Transcript_33412/g.77071 Transcript_33412/m.77071 type:complete len:229 (-) Transcript_33412:495-1181(-)|eukprot:CAMPEP_0113297066 /NCGR_PEP_ID=MMETSP0010_2-20120614/85_1 /TAXON_ID=216773 ORGANISM="Corethron hystrix, Strain 308" /NCGR_SAMPLE_ID=MMETSP0010_2 /ASSEMBLY_ACC=CAM_ASM_000155 /LENGTH=228 /DNA_ID=CAMNT_0000149897 /DNA_START=194 /DNA_END=880 /DNA_ORIENTATION=+ /assembly_acc=CAM_ASM_000155
MISFTTLRATVHSSSKAAFNVRPIKCPSAVRSMGMTSAQRRAQKRIQVATQPSVRQRQDANVPSALPPPPPSSSARASSTSSPPSFSSGLSEVPGEVRNRNIATAAALSCFVGGVWYYCVSAVGGDNGDAIDEADRVIEERRKREKEAEEPQLMVHVHRHGLKATEEKETVVGMRKYEGAKEDEPFSKVETDTSAVDVEYTILPLVEKEPLLVKRPLWKRVIFFWKQT